jgi:hypothetical protein
MLVGLYFYSLPSGSRLHMKRRIGWCSECRTFCPVEVLPERRGSAELEAELGSLKAESIALHARRSRLRAASLLPWKRQEARLNVSEIDKELERLDSRIWDTSQSLEAHPAAQEFNAARLTGPKCLECGSERVAPELIEDITSHPDCGGSLTWRQGEGRIAWAATDLAYDVEGLVISVAHPRHVS